MSQLSDGTVDMHIADEMYQDMMRKKKRQYQKNIVRHLPKVNHDKSRDKKYDAIRKNPEKYFC